MKKIIVLMVALMMILTLTSCIGNNNIFDGLSNKTNTFKYLLTEEAGVYHLHEIDKWSDSGSDAVGVQTKCCGNILWTSYNKAVLYQEYPEELPENVIICGNGNKGE